MIVVFAPYLAGAKIASKINAIGGALRVVKYVIDKAVEISSAVENTKSGFTLKQELEVVQEKSKKDLIDQMAKRASKKLKVFKKEEVVDFLKCAGDLVEDKEVGDKIKDLADRLKK